MLPLVLKYYTLLLLYYEILVITINYKKSGITRFGRTYLVGQSPQY